MAIEWKKNIGQYITWIAALAILAMGKYVITRLSSVEFQQHLIEDAQEEQKLQSAQTKRQWGLLGDLNMELNYMKGKQECMRDDITLLKGVHLK